MTQIRRHLLTMRTLWPTFTVIYLPWVHYDPHVPSSIHHGYIMTKLLPLPPHRPYIMTQPYVHVLTMGTLWHIKCHLITMSTL